MEEFKIEDYLEYDETSSSSVRWKKLTPGNKRCKVGDEWGGSRSCSRNYRKGVINNTVYSTHRVVYYLHYGIWSDRVMVVNHKDNNPSNNRIDNLELIPNLENCTHQDRPINSNNTSGYRGIERTRNPNRFIVYHRGIKRGSVYSLEEGLEVQRLSEEYHHRGLVYKLPPYPPKGYKLSEITPVLTKIKK